MAGAASANERSDAIEPQLRVADLVHRRQVLGRRPADVDGRGPPAASTAAMNRSPAAYWLSLPSIPVSRSTSRLERVGPLAPLGRAPGRSARRRARGRRRRGSSSRRRGLRAATSARRSARSRRAARAWRSARRRRCRGPAGGRRRGRCSASRRRRRARRGRGRRAASRSSTRPVKWSRIHGTPVNWARWVSSWTSTQVRNSCGSKPKRCSSDGEVRADQVDRVVGRRHRSAHQQVVLAEHPAAHPAEQRAELGAGHLPRPTPSAAPSDFGSCSRPAWRAPGRAALERGDVGPDPRRPVDQLDRRPGRPASAVRWSPRSAPRAARSVRVADRRARADGAGVGGRRCAWRSARRAASRSATRRRPRATCLLFAVALARVLRGDDLVQVAADQADGGDDGDERAGSRRATSAR